MRKDDIVVGGIYKVNSFGIHKVKVTGPPQKSPHAWKKTYSVPIEFLDTTNYHVTRVETRQFIAPWTQDDEDHRTRSDDERIIMNEMMTALVSAGYPGITLRRIRGDTLWLMAEGEVAERIYKLLTGQEAIHASRKAEA
jgi:hypothetical protein